MYWPYFIIFSPRVNICWAIMSRICIFFFTQSLELRKQFLSHILILQRFDQFFSFFYEYLHFRQRHKKIVNLTPFYRTEFSNSFCQHFFYSPFICNKDFITILWSLKVDWHNYSAFFMKSKIKDSSITSLWKGIKWPTKSK